jgi:hypothetical protein
MKYIPTPSYLLVIRYRLSNHHLSHSPERTIRTMRHLTPFPLLHSIAPSSTRLYTFLSFSPITCLPHVTPNVALNPGLERPCIVCRQYQIVLQKMKKALLKILNVDPATINVASNVALNPALERPCIVCRQYQIVFSKTKKLPLETRNVGSLPDPFFTTCEGTQKSAKARYSCEGRNDVGAAWSA